MSDSSKNKGLGDLASKRREAVRVKTAKKRSTSSAQWLKRQLNDPYVAASKEMGYRSRAAFKILQLNEKYKFLKAGKKVVDLGAAPGGWSQVAAQKIGARGKLVALDLLPIEPIGNADIIQMDFLADDAPARLMAILDGTADIVMSDMAPSTTGHTATDHLRIMALAESAAHFAMEILAPGGCFICKYFKGGTEKALLDQLKKSFEKVHHAKPESSRADSSESFIVALGFRKR